MLFSSQTLSRRCFLKISSRGKPQSAYPGPTADRGRYTSSQAARTNDEANDGPSAQSSPKAPSPPLRTGELPDAQSLGSSPQDLSTLTHSSPQTATRSQNYSNWKRTTPKKRDRDLPVVNLTLDSSSKDLKSSLRALLREVAQPVAVVTSYMPPQELEKAQALSSTPSPETTQHHLFHGATLSSFSSVSMDPHPLVAFALRVPSRMATTLTALVPTPPSPPPVPPRQPSSGGTDRDPTHLVLNILSSNQHAFACSFSRPDLHPHPFESARYTLSADGLPILDRALGALSCKVVARVKLSELGGTEDPQSGIWSPDDDRGVASELFIAQVVRIEDVPNQHTIPLLYRRQGYTSPRHRPISRGPSEKVVSTHAPTCRQSS